MKTHRIWTIATLIWFFALFNVERLLPQIDIASFVYGLAAVVGVSMLASPLLRRHNFGIVAAGFSAVWLIGKCILGYSLDLEALPIALLEVSSLIVSQYLCLEFARHTDEFELTSRQMLDVLKATSVPTVQECEPAFLEEIRRARRHERPLTFVALTPGTVTSDVLAALAQTVTASLSKEYVLGGISRILQLETKSHDLAVRVGDQILMLLPETDVDQASAMCKRLQMSVAERLQIPVNTEAFAFGSDELTLTGVMDRLGRQNANVHAPKPEIFELRLKETTTPEVSRLTAS